MSFNLSRPGDDTVRQRPLFVPGIGSDDPYSDAWLPERDISRTHSGFRSSQVQNIQQTEKEDDELSKSSPRDKREMEKEKDTRGRETNDKENTNAAAASPRARSQSVRSGHLQGSPTSRPRSQSERSGNLPGPPSRPLQPSLSLSQTPRPQPSQEPTQLFVPNARSLQHHQSSFTSRGPLTGRIEPQYRYISGDGGIKQAGESKSNLHAQRQQDTRPSNVSSSSSVSTSTRNDQSLKKKSHQALDTIGHTNLANDLPQKDPLSEAIPIKKRLAQGSIRPSTPSEFRNSVEAEARSAAASGVTTSIGNRRTGNSARTAEVVSSAFPVSLTSKTPTAKPTATGTSTEAQAAAPNSIASAVDRTRKASTRSPTKCPPRKRQSLGISDQDGGSVNLDSIDDGEDGRGKGKGKLSSRQSISDEEYFALALTSANKQNGFGPDCSRDGWASDDKPGDAKRREKVRRI